MKCREIENIYMRPMFQENLTQQVNKWKLPKFQSYKVMISTEPDISLVKCRSYQVEPLWRTGNPPYIYKNKNKVRKVKDTVDQAYILCPLC